MHISTLSAIVALMTSCQAHILHQRTAFEVLREDNKTALLPARIENLPPRVRKDAIHQRLYFGPFKLPSQKGKPAPSGHGHKENEGADTDSTEIRQRITGFCHNCTVLYGKSDIYTVENPLERATIASGVYNHHLLILDPEKTSLLPWYICPGQKDLGRSKSAGFMIAGVAEAVNWFTTPDGEFKSGYYIGNKQQNFSLNAALVNYNEKESQVYVTTEVEWVPGKEAGVRDASMSLLSVTG